MRVLLFIALFVVSFGSALAGTDSYVCSISTFARLNNDGNLIPDPNDPIIGQEFAVDRTSGKIIGKYIGSTGFNMKVLDHGSNQQSFKVLATSSAGFVHVLYLNIQEFSPSDRKAFILVDASLVYSGTCQ